MKTKHLLSVLALSLSFVTSAYGQKTVADNTSSWNIEDVQMETGAQKQVAISLMNPSKKLTAFQLDLVMPEGVTVDISGATLNPSRIDDHELHVAQMNDNTYRFLAFSRTNADFAGTSGALIYVPIVTGEDINTGALTASVESPLVCASDGTNNDLASVSFNVQVNGKQTFTFTPSGLLACVSKFDLDFSTLDNVKAYIATGYDTAEDELLLTRVYDVPAGTPIWMNGPAEETVSVSGTPSNSYYPETFLAGQATAATEVPASTADTQNWILNQEGQLEEVTSSTTIEAGKVYLHLPKTAVSNVAAGASIPFMMPNNGKLTYVGKYNLDFSNMEGLKAYAVTGFTKGRIWLTPVKKASAGTPLYVTAEQKGDYMVPSTEIRTAYANMLQGDVNEETDLTTLGDGISTLILSNDKFTVMSSRVIAMLNPLMPANVYMPVPTKNINDPATNKAYDISVAEAEVMSIKLSTMTTGISRVKASRKDEGIWYNLQGQRVENPRKGLYIQDGNKVFVK